MALYVPNDANNEDGTDSDPVSYLCDSKIFTVCHGLSKKECAFWINRAEQRGFNDSSPSGGGHGRTGREDARTSQFVVFQNEAKFANQLYNAVKRYLPADLTHLSSTGYITSTENAQKWKHVGVNPYVRVYKYEVGQKFPEHVDYKMCRKVYRNGEQYQQMTFMSLIVYLNDDFSGGHTGFWTQHDVIGKKEHCRFLRGVEHKPHDVVIQPELGKIAIMDQNILHEGLAPTKGVKYIIRTDIIHERHIAMHAKLQKFKENSKQIKKMNKKQTEQELNEEGEWEKLFETSCKNYAD